MDMAYRRGLIQSNIFRDIRLNTVGCKPPSKYSSAERIVNDDEIQAYFHQLRKDLVEDPTDAICYCAAIQARHGLRIGEAVSIKESDIDFKNAELHIHRMDVYVKAEDSDSMKRQVVNFTKKRSLAGDRFLPLSEHDMSIFRTVLENNRRLGYHDNGFAFLGPDGRITYGALEHRIQKYTKLIGSKGKASHALRRTAASKLYDATKDINLVKEVLGHSQISTSWRYVYDVDSKEKRAKIITDSLESLNGLKGTQFL